MTNHNLSTITLAAITTLSTNTEIYNAAKNENLVHTTTEFWTAQRASGLTPLAFARSLTPTSEKDNCPECGDLLYGEPDMEPGAWGGEICCMECNYVAPR